MRVDANRERDPVVVDTGVFAAGLTAKSDPLAQRYRTLLAGRLLIISVQTISELYFGALKSGWGTSRLREVDRRIGLAVIAPCDDYLARAVAQVRLACLRVGHPLAQPVHTNDLWIASVAIRYDVPLVSADRVFGAVPGLSVLTPAD